MGHHAGGWEAAVRAAAEAEAWAAEVRSADVGPADVGPAEPADWQVSEHATYVVDVRAGRRARAVWLTTGVTLALLAAGPLWGALTGGAARAEGSRSHLPPSTAAGPGAPAALDEGDPAPQEPTGQGDVAGLDPMVRRAVDRAVAAAAADGLTLSVTSGRRSREHQARLYDAAVEKYGSAAKARRWVLPPGESAHVQGVAVDVGPRASAAWLEEHGVRFGLCRRYANEPWHFELLAPHKGQPCPAMEPHA